MDEQLTTKRDIARAMQAKMIMDGVELDLNACEKAIDALVDTAQQQLAKHGKFALRGIGTLVVNTLKERKSRNPSTGKVFTAPAVRVVRFKVSQPLKVAVN